MPKNKRLTLQVQLGSSPLLIRVTIVDIIPIFRVKLEQPRLSKSRVKLADPSNPFNLVCLNVYAFIFSKQM